jgi:glycosyltransferase involved in cell wall biosynthesis
MRGGVKLVHTIHGWGHTPADSRLRRAMLIRAERVAARWTDALVAVSSDVRDEGLRCRIGHLDQYEVIPEFVVFRPGDPDFDASRQRARRALGLEDADEVVGWVGRFVPQKDPDTLVRALEQILESRTRVRAVLIGDGPMRRDTEHRLRGTGVGERVVFAGLRPDVRALYAAFDVLLHTSLWEGQPLVIQEAIAERVPVVATRVTGTDDLIEEGRTGYLTRPGDGEGMAEHALAALEGTGLRAPLATEIVAEVSARHGHELALTRHLALYERLLAGSTAAHA